MRRMEWNGKHSKKNKIKNPQKNSMKKRGNSFFINVKRERESNLYITILKYEIYKKIEVKYLYTLICTKQLKTNKIICLVSRPV